MNLKIVFSIILFTFNFINGLVNDATKVVSSGIYYAINYETSINNINNFEEINKLRDKYFEEIYKNLEEADKNFVDNNLSVRGCSWMKFIACSVYTISIATCLSAILPPVVGACIAGMGTGAVYSYENC
ncbi:hypothetical protein PIROE2DRAFT_2238 [Piromyces sp. E2]|nr:hypothetical protein PIROE2DRAFT_2238 [Piromyces sp. E2]|eukprot:OUM69808.1 hypothetical protein PIROE2DRAFT_2238 [Piromyces sp. E2]